MDNTRYVYAIFACRDSVYIGRTTDLIRRMKQHDMLNCDWAVLETTDSLNVRKAEAAWVKRFLDLGVKLLNIDNLCRDGNLGHSEETRRKIGDAQRGSRNHRFGKSNTEELRKATSERMKGNKYAAGSPGRIFTKQEQIKGGHSSWAKNISKLLAAANPSRAGRISAHKRYHVVRNIINPKCFLCVGGGSGE